MLRAARRFLATARLCCFRGVGFLVLLASIAFLVFLSNCSTAKPQSFSDKFAYHPAAKIAVVGDLQRTSLLEFWREQNDNERSRIVAHIAAGKPDLLVMLGDLVFNGSSKSQWEDFDILMRPVRDSAIPALSAVGNHEHWLRGRSNLDSFFQRLPLLGGKTWSSFVFGPLGILILDSNQDQMSEALWDSQIQWYQAELDKFEKVYEVRGVLVFLHHPPFTNSSVTSDELHVQQAFVPALIRSKKTRAMIAGHVHSYERFESNGKVFVVSGGGGGPRAKLLEGDSRRHPDDLFSGPNPRQFHVLWLSLETEGLRVEVSGIDKGGSDFRVIDRFRMPWELIPGALPR